MPPHLIAALSILILSSGFSSLAAQNESSDWFFRAWQTEDGLPDNSVAGVAQGPDGYLWLATNGGLMRFNGTEFTPLPLHTIPGLPSRQVRAMFLDRSGRLWLSMERGPVIRVDKDACRAFTFDDGIIDKVVNSMVDDPQGRLWIAFSNGICRIEADKVTRIETRQWFPHPAKASLACDTRGQVWLANGGKFGRLGAEGFELVRDFGEAVVSITASADSGIWLSVDSQLMRLEEGDRFQDVAKLENYMEVVTLFEDRDRALWIGTHGAGLLRYKDQSLLEVPTSYAWVSSITQDREGNIWAGTVGGGLNLIKPRVVDLYGRSDGLPFTSVRSITCDAAGRLWAVSHSGRLAWQESGQWHLFNKKDDMQQINCVTADSEGTIWIGTRFGGLLQVDDGETKHYGKSDGLAGPFVRSLFAASNGDILIATDTPSRLNRLRNGKISQIEHTGSMRAIRAMAETSDGTIWIGTSDGRLLRVADDRLIDENSVEDIPSIRTLHATPDGSLWIGYAGEGLGHLKNGKYHRFTTEDGLHDDYISQIQHDENGSLWIAANRGLFQVSLAELPAPPASVPTQLRCRVFGRNDDLPSFQPSRDYSPDSCRGPDNRLYFSTSSGLVQVRPETHPEATLPPPVVLEKVTVDGRIKALYHSRSMQKPEAGAESIELSQPDQRMILPPGHERLVISFAGLSLASPENVMFRYRLKPLDKDWEEPENGNSATFTRLSAGEYQFEVIACNSHGVWNKTGASLEIVVQPFFWETWWFRIGGGICTALAAGGLVFLGLRRKHRSQLQRIAAKRALEQERSRIARDIHDDLGASLTRISLLSQSSPNTDDEPTKVVLGRIQDTARHLMRSMDGVVWAIDPEHDTFDDLANYLSSHAQEFLSVAGVSCRLNMPVDLPEFPLTAQIRHNLFLAFKEALNNVVKYAGATEVRISLLPGDGFFTLRIQDNGRGIDPDAPADPGRPNAGSGLANMESRMNEIGGTCILQSTPGLGTTVEFRIPFNTKS